MRGEAAAFIKMLIRRGIFTADVLMQFGNGRFVLQHITEPFRTFINQPLKADVT